MASSCELTECQAPELGPGLRYCLSLVKKTTLGYKLARMFIEMPIFIT